MVVTFSFFVRGFAKYKLRHGNNELFKILKCLVTINILAVA